MKTINRFGSLFRTFADNVTAALLSAIFATFIFQIIARYLLVKIWPAADVGWTLELCMDLWIWVVFWGAAFCLHDRDHIRFDLLYNAVNPAARRVFALLAALTIVALFLASVPATYSYITFYKIKKTALLKIRFDYLFSIYGVFLVMVIVHYAIRIIAILRHQDDGHRRTSDDEPIDMRAN